MDTIGCKKRLSSFLALLFFSIPAFSANGHIYLGASIAASFANLENNSPQISYLSGVLITDAYPLNNNHASSSVVSVNGGYEFPSVNGKPAIALGLGLYDTPNHYNYNGQLVETVAGDASSTLYNYSYNIKSTRIMAEIQLTWMLEKFAPFINLGVGPTWNKMNDYTETAVDSSGYVPLPPFQTHTNSNVAYQAGFGISKAFNFAHHTTAFLQERIAVGYQYVNLGETSFGTRGSVYPYQLNTSRLTTNEVYLSYTHLF